MALARPCRLSAWSAVLLAKVESLFVRVQHWRFWILLLALLVQSQRLIPRLNLELDPAAGLRAELPALDLLEVELFVIAHHFA